MKTRLSPLPFEELEDTYSAIAEAIDSVEPERQTLFLAKLALVLARSTGNPDLVADAIAVARRDLDLP